MALFEVPGWDVPAAPVTQTSKKRKRPTAKDTDDVDEAERMHAAQRNIEKLMRSLGEGMGALDGGDSSAVSKNKQKREGKEKAAKAADKQGKGTAQQRGRTAEKGGKKSSDEQRARPQSKSRDGRVTTGPSSPSRPNTTSSSAPAKNKKKQKHKQAREESVAAASDAESIHEPLPVERSVKVDKKDKKDKSKDDEQGLTPLQAGLKKKLGGARFRCVKWCS